MNEHADLLPAWFSSRMMQDDWTFGLLMCDGTMIAISNIERITKAADNTLWLDVLLLDYREKEYCLEHFSKTLVAPTSRQEASINASNVMAAFELADT